jgi:hypothetical protein
MYNLAEERKMRIRIINQENYKLRKEARAMKGFLITNLEKM